MATKVTRDGAVMLDGAQIGTVVKEMRQGIFATLMGASYSAAGTPYWVPFDADGTKLSDGYDTRKRAVSRVEKQAQPMTVEHVKVENYYGLFSTEERKYVSAWVSYKGFSFGVSRYATEDYWVIDTYYTPDSIMPVFSNGGGTRVTRARVLQGDAEKAATDAAIAAGVWPIL
jgi:hypothetical protein